MPIYTRKGDQGKTSLVNGQKIWKNSQRTTTYGTVDELNCNLGVVVAEIGKSSKRNQANLLEILTSIQNDLFYIGSFLANPESRDVGIDLKKRVEIFEKKIDEMASRLPVLKNFILPGGGRVGALLQVCRAVARRAEREVITLSQKEKIDENVLVYFNRLSDLLFTMSRFANFSERKKETIWKK